MMSPGPQSKKVLVVEDDAGMQRLFADILRKAGFQVEVCADGWEAWERLSSAKPDLMVVDVMLPGIDGYTLQQKLDQDDTLARTPVIITSAIDSTKALFEKYPRVAGFLSKPFRAADLLSLADKALSAGTKDAR